MPKPPKPPRVKKSLDWDEEAYNDICRYAKKQDATWAEMARRVIKLGIWAYRSQSK